MHQLKLSSSEEARLHFAVEIGLASSAMMRLYQKGSTKVLQDKILAKPRAFEAETEEQYKSIHRIICNWGTRNIELSKGNGHASYGQIAKTLDVALKVIIYFCHLPDCDKSKRISKWLNAPVDTNMMAWLKKLYPEDAKSWPTTLGGVDDDLYASIQRIVRKFIDEERSGDITPVEFDNIYWEALNR